MNQAAKPKNTVKALITNNKCQHISNEIQIIHHIQKNRAI